MTDATPARPRERELELRYTGICRDCGTTLEPGTRARWDSVSRSTRCLTCPSAQMAPPSVIPATPSVPAPRITELERGVAGASAQRQFDRREGQRRARLRANWHVISAASVTGAIGGAFLTAAAHSHGPLLILLGAVLPVVKLLPTPQHIDAWRSGAAGERAVGARLDALRPAGVLAVHDRRVPGRRTNIDHIAVAAGGVFVIDTKNVAGKVTMTRSGLRVAGRRRDDMVTGVQTQVTVVRQALADQGLPAALVRGVLCFTRADLPWPRPSAGGVPLLYPRGLARALRRQGPLSAEQVHHLADLLAQRLPVA